jgi:hypothetical protein
LVSGDYVLVPKKPTEEMERAGMAAGAGFLAKAFAFNCCLTVNAKLYVA